MSARMAVEGRTLDVGGVVVVGILFILGCLVWLFCWVGGVI